MAVHWQIDALLRDWIKSGVGWYCPVSSHVQTAPILNMMPRSLGGLSKDKHFPALVGPGLDAM